MFSFFVSSLAPESKPNLTPVPDSDFKHKKYLAYRGDSRDPSVVFQKGMQHKSTTSSQPVLRRVSASERQKPFVDVDSDTGVCLTRRIDVAPLFPYVTLSTSYPEKTWIYFVYVHKGFSTYALQRKENCDLSFSKEIVAREIPPGKILGAIQCERYVGQSGSDMLHFYHSNNGVDYRLIGDIIWNPAASEKYVNRFKQSIIEKINARKNQLIKCPTAGDNTVNSVSLDEFPKRNYFVNAILTRNFAFAARLLEEGADPNRLEPRYRSPLMMVIGKGNPSYWGEEATQDSLMLIPKMLEHEADPDIGGMSEGTTPVLECVYESEYNLNPGYLGKKELTESFEYHYAICKMLLEKGANPDKPDNTGLTPLIVAIIQNKKDHGHKFVELLLQHNASLKDVKVNVEALKSINAENKYRGGKPEDDLLFQQFLNKMRGNNSYASEVTVSPIELAMAIGNQITKDMLASKRYFEQRLFSPRSLPLSTSIPVAPEALGKKLGSTGS